MQKEISFRTHLVVYGALLVLLGSTVGLSYVSIGRWNFAVAFAIAAAKAALVIVYFMQLKRSMRLSWLYAGVGAVWLLIATVLTFADYLTRGTPAYLVK